MTAIKISIENKTFTQTEAPTIANFKLTLNSGEFVCLVGSSGCGKTTLLNILSGLDNDYQGEVSLEKLQTSPKIGYVFQNPRLLPWRTVRENIELANPIDNVDDLLDAMNLSDIQQQYPQHLSLGMSRRVSIIRAFSVNPDILLMDEPFVSLDPPTARQVRELLINLWQQQVIVIEMNL